MGQNPKSPRRLVHIYLLNFQKKKRRENHPKISFGKHNPGKQITDIVILRRQAVRATR
jgi:hypothetical protein